MKRIQFAVLAFLALGGGALAQNYTDEVEECMRNPTSRWCQTMQQEDRQQSYDQNERFARDRRAQMCAINPRYCY